MSWRRPTRRRSLLMLVVLAMILAACNSGTGTTTTADESGPGDTNAPTTESSTESTPGDTTETTASEDPDGEEGSDRYGGTLTVAQGTDPDTLSPYIYGAQPTRNVLIQLYDTLVRNDLETYEIVPSLAESWEVSDDGLTWTFTLREATFHDGSELTADDVVWSLEQAMDEAATRTAPLLSFVESAEAADDRTFVVNLSSPDNIFLSTLLDVYITPDDPEIDYQDGPIGTGPFQFVTWDRNQQIVLERYEDYWMTDDNGDQLPYLDEIIIKPVPDGSVQALQLENGESDLLPTVDFAQVEQLQEAGMVLPEL